MKVIFLDHQGVLYLKRHPCPGDLDAFDPAAIQVLNTILDADPEIQLVVSSDWRRWCSFEVMQEFYRTQGIHRIPIDKTPWLGGKYQLTYRKQRAEEINDWLSHHPDVTQWVAIDDLDLKPYLEHFVQTDYHKGLLEEGIQAQIQYFFIFASSPA